MGRIMDRDSAIDIELLKRCMNGADGEVNEVIKNAVIANGIDTVAFNNASKVVLHNHFSTEIKTGKITSQEKSGRCWMFAGLNLFRPVVVNKLNIDDFEFSQNYMMFFDKFEKANYFLESILKTLDEDIYSRIIMWLLAEPLQDGGQWDMFVNLIKKYGAVPKNIMPETYHSNNSALMNQLLSTQLRQWASDLRTKYRTGVGLQDLRKLKKDYLKNFYRMLTYFLGDPPSHFIFEYRNKSDVLISAGGITPLAFYTKYVNTDLDNYVSLIHAPTPDKPFGKTYTIDFLGNVAEGKRILYLNTPLDTIRECMISQLNNKEPVWFGCDVGWQTERKKGLMDTEIFLYGQALGSEFSMDKSNRLLYGQSKLTHAMVITGYHDGNGKPVRWKVENSWGEERGEKGFFIMSDSWLNEYAYQFVIHKKYMPEDLIRQTKQDPVVLPPWDPMGSLAV